VRLEFAYDGGGIAKGGTATLFVDGAEVASGRVERTEPMVFSADETCDVGVEYGSPVTEDYGPRGNSFNGDVLWVEIDLGDLGDDHDHLISPADRLRVAFGTQ
jgi:arylsulfatase